MSEQVAESFKEALWKVEEDRDVEPMISVLSEDCEVGNVAVPKTFRGHDEAREFWSSYRKTFDEMKSTFRNIFAEDGRAALEWTTEGTENGDTVSYEGVSILEIEGDKVKRFMAYFDPSYLNRQIVD
ncbi:MAG: nuclear transport factor 2 family protein [Rubrobacteraceae bacterium]